MNYFQQNNIEYIFHTVLNLHKKKKSSQHNIWTKRRVFLMLRASRINLNFLSILLISCAPILESTYSRSTKIIIIFCLEKLQTQSTKNKPSGWILMRNVNVWLWIWKPESIILSEAYRSWSSFLHRRRVTWNRANSKTRRRFTRRFWPARMRKSSDRSTVCTYHKTHFRKMSSMLL